MNEPMDRQMISWLAEGPERSPDELLERSLAATRRTPQRRWWAVPSRWLPASVTGIARSETRSSLLMLLVAFLLALAVVAALVIAGSQRRLPPPVGPAGNGKVAYDTGKGGMIYVSNPDGTEARPLIGAFGTQRSPTFSPDGTQIAFWRRSSDVPGVAVAPPTCCPARFELWVVNADGTNAHKVSGDVPIYVDPGTVPGWSPDNTRLVFHSDVDGVEQLFVSRADGSSSAVAITGRDASRWAPVWSPDGAWIAFGMATGGAQVVAMTGVVRPDGSDERTFGGQPYVEDTDGAFAWSLAWSPDSTRFSFMRGNDDSRTPETQYWAFLDVVDIRDGSITNLYQEQSGALYLPEWSPDGASIAFVTSEGLSSLRLVHLDGGKPDILRQCGGMLDHWLRWSPDGKSIIAFCEDVPYLIPLDDPRRAAAMTLPHSPVGVDWQRVAK